MSSSVAATPEQESVAISWRLAASKRPTPLSNHVRKPEAEASSGFCRKCNKEVPSWEARRTLGFCLTCGEELIDLTEQAKAVQAKITSDLRKAVEVRKVLEAASTSLEMAAFTRTPALEIDLRGAGICLHHAGSEKEEAFYQNFCKALASNRELKRLDMSENEIGDHGMKMLAAALTRNQNLHFLSLAGNSSVSDEGVEAIARAIRGHRALDHLDLSKTGLADAGTVALAEMLKYNSTLRVLMLEGTGVTFEGGKALMAALECNNSLEVLKLPAVYQYHVEKIQHLLSPEERLARRWRLKTRVEKLLSPTNGPMEPPLSVPVIPTELPSSEEQERLEKAVPEFAQAAQAKLSSAYQQLKLKRHGMLPAKTNERGITALQVKELRNLLVGALQQGPETMDDLAPEGTPSRGKALSWETLNLYQVDNYFTKPITAPAKCSWVEFITGGEKQLPQWLISHAWATYFCHTTEMLFLHATSRYMDRWEHEDDLLASATYWCCAFSNNQHDLHELDEKDIMETPFAKVLRSLECQGTLLLCNPDVTPLQRVWCIFELHITHQLQLTSVTSGRPNDSQKPWHFMDVASPILDEQRLTSEGLEFKATMLQDDGSLNFIDVSAPHAYFPLEVAKVGVQVDIAKAEATEAQDRNAILNYVSRKASIRDQEPPPPPHPKYDELNGYVHGIFASAELYRLCCERPSDLAAVKQMIKLGADPSRFVRAGNTAVHAAVGADPSDRGEVCNSPELLELLLSSGGDPNVLNSHLCTALDYAKKRPDGEVFCSILRAYGAKPCEEVAAEAEEEVNSFLKKIISQGCHDEIVAFGARLALGPADVKDVKLQTPAELALRAAATKLRLYPRAACHLTVSPNIRPGMSWQQEKRQEQQARQRAEAVKQFLVDVGCQNSFKVRVLRQTCLLSLALKLRKSSPADQPFVAVSQVSPPSLLSQNPDCDDEVACSDSAMKIQQRSAARARKSMKELMGERSENLVQEDEIRIMTTATSETRETKSSDMREVSAYRWGRDEDTAMATEIVVLVDPAAHAANALRSAVQSQACGPEALQIKSPNCSRPNSAIPQRGSQEISLPSVRKKSIRTGLSLTRPDVPSINMGIAPPLPSAPSPAMSVAASGQASAPLRPPTSPPSAKSGGPGTPGRRPKAQPRWRRWIWPSAPSMPSRNQDSETESGCPERSVMVLPSLPKDASRGASSHSSDLNDILPTRGENE